MTHHVPVSHPVYYAAHRSRLISGLGGRVRRLGDLTEFVTPGGEILCRKLTGLDGDHECWLSADLAEAAQAALHAEAAESARIAAEVIAFSLGRDSERAAEQGVSLEQYRQVRNHTLARIDQRRGKNSVGLG